MRGRFVIALVTSLFVPFLLCAQDVEVIRNVNLRRDPSTSQPPKRLLKPPDMLELVEPNPSNSYYHVVTSEGEEGWVWGRNVKILTATPSFLSATAATSISDSWTKPAPTDNTFTSDGKTCEPTGDGGDPETNRRKNRIDVPTSAHNITWRALAELPYPTPLPKKRDTWTTQQRAEVGKFEGSALQVVGYIVAIKPQTGGNGETTNCHWTKSAEVDWHVALVEQPGNGEETSVVIETTPRIRRNHPKWTPSALKPWLDTDKPVRITGWLMLDPEHQPSWKVPLYAVGNTSHYQDRSLERREVGRH